MSEGSPGAHLPTEMQLVSETVCWKAGLVRGNRLKGTVAGNRLAGRASRMLVACEAGRSPGATVTPRPQELGPAGFMSCLWKIPWCFTENVGFWLKSRFYG